MDRTRTLREVMTTVPVALSANDSVGDAARAMRDSEIGDVLVLKDGELCGIVTDRDLVVRVLADGHDPATTKLEAICTRDPLTLAPEVDADDAVLLMRQRAIRRIPVAKDGVVVGIVSLGDLARELDKHSTLAAISGADPNN